MSDIKFGEIVLVTGNLVRERTGTVRIWKEEPFKIITPAIFLGDRTLYNGVMKYTDSYDEDGGSIYYFKYTEKFPGACICIEGRKPQNVAFSQLIRI